MNDAYEIGAIALSAQQRALDVIANNIANVNTPAFKRSDVRFAELLARLAEGGSPSAGLGKQTFPSGVLARTATAFDQGGEVRHTGKTMDIAISGAGLIELMGPQGRPLLWRGGTLSVSEEGLLATTDGIPLRALISMPADASDMRIDADGSVTAVSAADGQRTALGRIELVRLADTSELEALDGGVYAAGDGARLETLTAGDGGAGLFVQGGIEQSNVEINDEMVQLMIVQRSYAANAQIVQAADQLAAITNNLRK